MIGVFLLYAGAILGLFALMAAISDRLEPEEDESGDLEWLEREIARAEEKYPITPEARERQREHLERLHRVQKRLLGH